MSDAHQQQLLLQAAEAAVGDFQAGKVAASVADILHLEKRWDKLPGASTGSVALEDAKALLGAEVLADDPLEYVTCQVFPGGPPPPVLTKRQFLALAHVAEVAQSRAFDLMIAEDALRPQAPSASHKKRPPAIRDAHIDTWQITAAPPPPPAAVAEQQQLQAAHEPYDAAAAAMPYAGLLAASALAADAPGPLEAAHSQGAGRLSRATSLHLAAGPLECGVQALSHQGSLELGGLTAAAAAAMAAEAADALSYHDPQQQQQHYYHSAATSYQSALEVQEGELELALQQEEEEAVAAAAAAAQQGEERQSRADAGQALFEQQQQEQQFAEEQYEEEQLGDETLPAGEEADDAVDDFAAKLNGLMQRMSSDMAQLHVGGCPPTPPRGLLAPGEGGSAAAAAGAAEDATGMAQAAAAPANVRSSWESFGATPPASAAAPAAAAPAQSLEWTLPMQPLAAQPGHQQQQQQQQPMDEAVVAAAMAAGMTFMQHLQAASGGAQPSPFSDINPLRRSAAAAAAASPGVSVGAQQAAGSEAASPEVLPSSGGGAAAAAHQQMIAGMFARMAVGEASPGQLDVAAASLHQHALALQHQHQQSVADSHQAPPSNSPRRSWRAFEDAHPQQQQQQQPQPGSPQKLSRLGTAGNGTAGTLLPLGAPAAPPAGGIAGWDAMSKDDVARAAAIFNKKGYPGVGGMELHSAMEYFSRLRMEASLFQQAWQAADMGGDGKLDCREFCLFAQLLRGAQKGRRLPARPLAAAEAAALLGEAPMPAAAAPAGRGALLHIDSARMRSALSAVHSRQASMVVQEELGLQDFEDGDDDGASSVDSGIAESVSGMSTCSRPSQRRAGGRFGGGGSVLGGASAPNQQQYPQYQPLSERLIAGYMPAAAAAELVRAGAHSLLEVAVRSAEMRYSKPLNTPIFTLSVRDSLSRLVELPVDTHPGHYRKETAMIHSSAAVKLATQLRSIPPGSVLFIEIKHFKADKGRFSTLAWAYAPLEKLVDFGPLAARVRNGPVDLPLFRKPLDPTLRRTKRLSSRSDGLHLTVRGIE